MKSGALLAVLGWLCVVCLAFLPVLNYQSSAGKPSNAGPMWPAISKLPHNTEGPTLVVFIHPQCPCSAASLDNLDKLAAKVGPGFRAVVVIEQPSYMDRHWSESAHARHAARIHGVATVIDHGQTEARLFDATTSGDTFLYNGAGRMLFHGGLTPGRGHEGDCLGYETVLTLMRGRTQTPISFTPAFGCALFNH